MSTYFPTTAKGVSSRLNTRYSCRGHFSLSIQHVEMTVLKTTSEQFLRLQRMSETCDSAWRYLFSWCLAFFASGRSHASDLALVGAKIYLSPTDPPIENGTILVHGGHILSVGPSAEIKVPRGTTVIDCKGLVVTAGFWNSHVHILLPGSASCRKTLVRADHVTTSRDAHAVGIHYRL